MPTIVVTTRDGRTVDLTVSPGISVMEAIRNAGLDGLLALCGGSCACATCHVYVDNEFLDRLPPQSNEEDDLLSTSSHRRANSRLSCQLPVDPSLERVCVTIAPEN